jgi:hypothetical protein
MFALGIDLGTRTQSNQGIRNGLPGTKNHASAKFAVRGQKRKFSNADKLGTCKDVYHGGHATGGTADRVDRVLRHCSLDWVVCAEGCCRGRVGGSGVDIDRRGLGEIPQTSLDRTNGVDGGGRTGSFLMPCDIPDGNFVAGVFTSIFSVKMPSLIAADRNSD